MAVLADRDIRSSLQSGRIRIDPYDPSCLQPSSVDLHLDADFRVFRNNRYPYIDVREPQPDLTELVSVGDDEPRRLDPVVRGEAVATGRALAPAADGRGLVQVARVDHAGVVLVAAGSAHDASSSRGHH